MWQGARRDHRHLLERVSLEHFHCVQPTDRHVRKLAICVASEVDVIGDGSRIEHFDNLERWASVKNHGPAAILQCQPDLLTIWCSCDVGTELAFLFYLPNDLVLGGGDNNRFRAEARANIAIFSVRRKNRHPRPIWHRDTDLFIKSLAIEDSDIVLTSNANPDLFAVRRKECLVR